MMPGMDKIKSLTNLRAATRSWKAATDKRIEAMAAALSDGHPIAAIAEAAEVSPQRMSQWRRELGFEPRTPGRKAKEQP